MADGILSLDQGTTSSKALLIDPHSLRVIGSSARSIAISSPRAGWVEQDAAELWESTRSAAEEVIAANPRTTVVAVAISNQRESVTAWNRTTGEPLTPVASWQDQRGVEFCSRLSSPGNLALVAERTGLELTAMYSAAKLRSLVDQTDGQTDVRLGTIDAWLLDRLTGGRTYATDAGNASRTLLFDIARLAWDEDLGALFGVNPDLLPEVRPSSGPWGVTQGVHGIPDGIPILAVLGDSHAALYGHWALAPEYAAAGKATYGTGSSVMVPTTDATARRAGVSTTVAWQLETPTWAFEANILYSGAGVDWLGNTLGVIGGRGLSELAAGAEDSGSAVFVPALNGLGAPWWEPAAVGTLTGLTASTSRAQIARAGLEAVAHQICDVLDVMDPTNELKMLHAGGGATSSALLMQVQSNMLDRELLVAKVADISPLGAGALAARGLGIEPHPDTASNVRFVPETSFTAGRRDAERARWHDALVRAGVARAGLDRRG